ncbi:cardiomyopathy-associated protein 5 [Elysia marginata]|uniref:Cardiomyopathy-associated protein 5 n=1 Tax=Elysia marginata TaxID=1093978 RepID=A0AAV4J2S4_9GAST|nr:cardiomyopathy-associated protein 5 [Elysia marginata]
MPNVSAPRLKASLSMPNTPLTKFKRLISMANTSIPKFKTSISMPNTSMPKFKTSISMSNTSIPKFKRSISMPNTSIPKFKTSIAMSNTSIPKFKRSISMPNTSMPKFKRSISVSNTSIPKFKTSLSMRKTSYPTVYKLLTILTTSHRAPNSPLGSANASLRQLVTSSPNLTGTSQMTFNLTRKRRYDYEDTYEWPPGDSTGYDFDVSKCAASWFSGRQPDLGVGRRLRPRGSHSVAGSRPELAGGRHPRHLPLLLPGLRRHDRGLHVLRELHSVL